MEDILNNVRSLRISRDDRTPDEKVHRQNVYVWNSPWISAEQTGPVTPQTAILTSMVKSSRETETLGDEYDLVPTATQLLLRSNAANQKTSTSLGSLSSGYTSELPGKRGGEDEESWTPPVRGKSRWSTETGGGGGGERERKR